MDGKKVEIVTLAEGMIQMIRLTRLKPLLAAAVIFILAVTGVAVLGRQESAAEGTENQPKTIAPSTPATASPDMPADRALARRELALIDETWPFLMVLATNHRIDISSGILGLWGRRRLEALHKAGAGKAEIVTVLVKYIKDLRELELVAIAQKEAGRVAVLGVHEMQFLRMEAQIWLNEEKAR